MGVTSISTGAPIGRGVGVHVGTGVWVGVALGVCDGVGGGGVTACGTGSLATVSVASGAVSPESVGFDAGDWSVTGALVDVGAGKVSASVGKTIAVPGWQADKRTLVIVTHANVTARMDWASRRGICGSSRQ
ncbi:MAG: hypothetical protein MUQ10_13010 [Anaerolineae bacterium]|nr:hypothetical protein [Anaerolineae bacterium]